MCLIDTWAFFPTSVGFHPRGRSEDTTLRSEVTGTRLQAMLAALRSAGRPVTCHQLHMRNWSCTPERAQAISGVIPVSSKTSASNNHKALVPHLQQPVSASCAARRLAKSPGGGAQGICGCSIAWSGP